MEKSAPPPDQVRPTQVGGGEIPVLITMKTSEQSPIKGIKNTETNASLTKRKDGSTVLVYSTKTDIEYNTFQEREWMTPIPTDFDMFAVVNRSSYARSVTVTISRGNYNIEELHGW